MVALGGGFGVEETEEGFEAVRRGCGIEGRHDWFGEVVFVEKRSDVNVVIDCEGLIVADDDEDEEDGRGVVFKCWGSQTVTTFWK